MVADGRQLLVLRTRIADFRAIVAQLLIQLEEVRIVLALYKARRPVAALALAIQAPGQVALAEDRYHRPINAVSQMSAASYRQRYDAAFQKGPCF